VKKIFKKLVGHTKEEIRISLIGAGVCILCILALYAVEKVDQLLVRITLVENRVLQVKNEQEQQRQTLQSNEEHSDVVGIRLDRMDSSNFRREISIVTINNETEYLENYIRAAHACFLVNEFAESAENICVETGDQYYCDAWAIYEESCIVIDEDGNWVLSPEPDVYHRLMEMYLNNAE